MTDEKSSPCCEGTEMRRRGLLGVGALAAAALLPGRAGADEDNPKARLRPQIGDLLARGDGTVLTDADLQVDGPPVFAWAMDPASKVLRDGSRLNQVLLLRFDVAKLGAETASRAADGIVAYSAVCTHAQCPVTGWLADRQVLHCPCHQSEYDPLHGGQVVGGPAPRGLAALPLKIVEGKPQVAGLFIGRVGMNQQMM